jgi:hypothetical protein
LRGAASLFTNIVNADGTLNDQNILRRENIYQGVNGRFVERFFIDASNTPYWDLYQLIDISHPDFPRESGRPLRNMILD